MGLLRATHNRAIKHTYLVIIITLGKLNESNTCHEKGEQDTYTSNYNTQGKNVKVPTKK